MKKKKKINTINKTKKGISGNWDPCILSDVSTNNIIWIKFVIVLTNFAEVPNHTY